jgi:hypothetical protein
MQRFMLVFVLSVVCARSTFAQGTPSEKDTCLTCHAEVGDDLAKPIGLIKDDVHGRRGLSCVNCHGGDPNEQDMQRSMDPRKGFIGKPAAKQVQSFCGKCHSSADSMKRFNPSLRVDQEAEYMTSVHGKRVAKGDTNAATCTSCHGSHGIRAVKDPNSPVYPTRVAETCGRCHANAETMKSYGIPTDQVRKYRSSVHDEALMKRQDLSAPTCNDCHGNHGAAPPGTASVGNVCGTCHVRQSELFGRSPHKAVFDAMNVSECVACHNNHDVGHPTDAFIGTGPEAVCVTCHSEGDRGHEAADSMHLRLIDLDGKISGAESILARAARAGMEVSKARFELKDAHDSLVTARVVIHSFSAVEVDKAVASGLVVADKARQAGENAMEELLFRRKGLAVSLLLIGLATISIYLKIRQIERRS